MKITSVETFAVQPWAWPLLIVRVRTSEPGLEGLGCASFKHRWHAVKAALDFRRWTNPSPTPSPGWPTARSHGRDLDS